MFAEDKGLVPNSQRDYFNENESRVEFEDALRLYFYDVLHKLYYDANRIKSDYKKQIDYASKVEDYNEKAQNNGFVDENARRKLFEAIEKAQKEAEEAQKRISKLQQMASNSPLIEVHKNIKNKYGSAISDNDKSKLEPVQDEKNS